MSYPGGADLPLLQHIYYIEKAALIAIVFHVLFLLKKCHIYVQNVSTSMTLLRFRSIDRSLQQEYHFDYQSTFYFKHSIS